MVGHWACLTTVGRCQAGQRVRPAWHRKKLARSAMPSSGATAAVVRGVHDPRVSINVQKRERVGMFKNPGERWCRKPTDVSTHDFPTAAVAPGVPYGVSDPELNRGHMCAGTPGSTADRAADAIRDRWRQKGPQLDRDANAL